MKIIIFSFLTVSLIALSACSQSPSGGGGSGSGSPINIYAATTGGLSIALVSNPGTFTNYTTANGLGNNALYHVFVTSTIFTPQRQVDYPSRRYRRRTLSPIIRQRTV